MHRKIQEESTLNTNSDYLRVVGFGANFAFCIFQAFHSEHTFINRSHAVTPSLGQREDCCCPSGLKSLVRLQLSPRRAGQCHRPGCSSSPVTQKPYCRTCSSSLHFQGESGHGREACHACWPWEPVPLACPAEVQVFTESPC